MKHIFSLFLLTFSLVLLGQDPVADTTIQVTITPEPKDVDKSEPAFVLYDVKVGANLIRSGVSLGNGRNSHELDIGLNFPKYHVGFNYGIENNERFDTVDYQSKGSYFRIGVDRNFVNDVASGNVISLGLRYARADYWDALRFTTDYGFGSQTLDYTNEDMKVRWYELVFNLRGRVVANLYAGFSARWQFGRAINGEGVFKTYDIPGFGTSKRQNSTAFDYYLSWRFSMGKE